MGLPEGYRLYPCDVCGDNQWFLALGPFDEQLAVACCGCDNIVHITADAGGSFTLNGDY